MTVSDGVSPSPKGGGEPARPPLNPPLHLKVFANISTVFREILVQYQPPWTLVTLLTIAVTFDYNSRKFCAL